VEREKKKKEKKVGTLEPSYEYAGQVVEALTKILREEWIRTVEVCSRSKRWWRQEFKQLRKIATKDKEARKLLRKKIKEAKKEQWKKFVEEGEDVWKIARIARNLTERCGSLQREDGQVVEEEDQEGKCRAFLEHNIICGQPTPETTSKARTRRSTADKGTRAAVRGALSKTKNSSAPGPDGVTWRLLKLIKDTRLGGAVLDDVGMVAQLDNRYYGEEEWRGMTMVMIPKPGKDHSNSPPECGWEVGGQGCGSTVRKEKRVVP